jgi:hypothetical protein
MLEEEVEEVIHRLVEQLLEEQVEEELEEIKEMVQQEQLIQVEVVEVGDLLQALVVLEEQGDLELLL